MNCPNCHLELKVTDHKGITIHRCTACEGFWFEGDEFKEAMEKEDQFLRWANFNLWKNALDHSLKNRAESCPDCLQELFEVRYKGSDIRPWVCVACHGVWVEKDELKKIINYLEEELDSQTVKDFIKQLGKEAVEILSHEKLSEQFRDLKTVLKLIGYRLFSRFQFLDKLSRTLPKP